MQLGDLSAVRLLVVGDVMLDRYWFGEVSRISPEAPVPVVKVERCEERLGGAANVARNAAALGAHAIAVLTEWEQYTHLDFERILASMTKPAFIFDGRNILDHARLFEMGFNVFSIGKPPQTHF